MRATALAATKGFTEMAKLLIDNGASVNAVTTYGATALMAACRNRQAPMVKLLLASGADAALKDENGETAIDHAKRAGEQAIVEMLQGGQGSGK